MAINVRTPEGETLSFPEAEDWEIGETEGELGNLQVGAGMINVAEFAKGSWAFVYETKDEPVEAKPRQWDKTYEIPSDVKAVTDRDGDSWTRTDADWNNPDTWLNDYAPFTEIP